MYSTVVSKLIPQNNWNSFKGTDEQKKVLTDMVMLIQSLRVHGRYLPFQKGIVINSRSLLKLCETLANNYSLSYLLTRRLNQDVLEHFFSVVRQMGCSDDHPTPLSFQYPVKNYIIGKGMHNLSTNTNTVDDESTTSLVNCAANLNNDHSSLTDELTVESPMFVYF